MSVPAAHDSVAAAPVAIPVAIAPATQAPQPAASRRSAISPSVPVQPVAATQTPVSQSTPVAPAVVAPAAAVVSPASASVVAVKAAATASTSVSQPAAASSSQTTVAIPSPAASIKSFVTAVNNFLTSLSSVLSGKTPAIPVDVAFAAIFGAVKRQETTDGQISTAATSQSAGNSSTATIEAESLTLAPSSTGSRVQDKTASSKYALAFTGSGTASAAVTIPASTTALTISARTSAGAPNMTLSIDGVAVTTLLIESTSYSTYTFAGALTAGKHVISLSTSTATTRNTLYLDKIVTSTGPIVDDFTGKSGAAPNGTIWTVRSGDDFVSDNATYTAANATLDGKGHLVLKATRAKDGRYMSGWVWSKNNVSFGYGTISVTAKMPEGKGLWPSLWMIGSNSDTVGWPKSGEIDMVELPSTTTTAYSTLHGPIAGTTDNQQAQLVTNLPFDLSDDYHRYWVTHLQNSITWGIDNITFGTITPESLAPGAEWVYNQPMYMIMNLSVGGEWPGEPDKKTQFPASMLIDSVRWDAASPV